MTGPELLRAGKERRKVGSWREVGSLLGVTASMALLLAQGKRRPGREVAIAMRAHFAIPVDAEWPEPTPVRRRTRRSSKRLTNAT